MEQVRYKAHGECMQEYANDAWTNVLSARAQNISEEEVKLWISNISNFVSSRSSKLNADTNFQCFEIYLVLKFFIQSRMPWSSLHGVGWIGTISQVTLN
jgi:hypothetical protein